MIKEIASPWGQACLNPETGLELRKMYEGGKIVTEQEENEVGYDKIQLVTISRPSAYGEYEPYHFVDSKSEFAEAVGQM